MSLETFIAFGDNHGDHADPVVVDALVRHIKVGFMGKPFKHRIHLGDLFDARPFRKGASAKERGESMEADRDAALQFVRKTRPTVLLLGNHDDRLVELASMVGLAGAEADIAAQTLTKLKQTLRGVGCKHLIAYDIRKGKYKLGPITFIHGYHHGAQAVRDSARTYNCRCLIMGHIHRIHRENVNKEDGCVGISVGCIADLERMEYAKRRSSFLTWGNGWVYGYVNTKTNQWRVFEAIPEAGQFHIIKDYQPL